jgi:DNA-binding MarR family transcriptional regulator
LRHQDRIAVGVNHWQGTPPHHPKNVIREREYSIAGSERAWEYIQMATESVEQRVDVLRQTIIALVRRDGPDLSARQLGVYLTSYLEDEAQTVRGLAAKLNVSKPAITRALDRLSEFDLVRRKTDPLDRRSVLVQRTVAGTAFLRDLKKILADAGKDAARVPTTARRTGALVGVA